MAIATGSFEVVLVPIDGPEPPIAPMTIAKTFSGDLTATSVGRMLAIETPVEGSAGYVALEHVTGHVAGRRGSFALQHFGMMSRGDGELRVTVVPDSGTDELIGLAGEMDIEISDGAHRYTFRYSIGGADAGDSLR